MEKIIKSRNEKFGLKIFFSLILISLCLVLITFPANAKVDITSTYYNSEATVTECLRTENADYSGITVLLPHTGYGGLPYSILSGGTGKSIDEEFSEFSHSIFTAMDENYEKVGASLKTESGEYEWKSSIKASSDLVMGMSVECEIENGNLEASYSNSFTTHTEELKANGAKYSDATTIIPSAIASSGIGKGSESEFSHTVFVENEGDCENIEAYLKTDSGEYEWKKSVNTRPNEISMGMSAGYKLGDGNIMTLYRNSDSTVSENLIAEGLQYSGSAAVTPNAIIAAGAGKSEQDVASSKFSHETYVESNGKWAKIETNLESTSVEYQLNNKAKVLPQEVLVSVLEKGGTKDGTVATEIYGTASNFPLQHLPPGQFDYNAVPVIYMYTENLGWNVYDLNNPPESAPPETFAPLIADGDFTFDLSMGFTWKSANGFG
ncbi:MAG: hypothetical protein KAT65_25210 [Methanophagales archaeon]|nr:hypothetical protein [Methanophagales archaeon]